MSHFFAIIIFLSTIKDSNFYKSIKIRNDKLQLCYCKFYWTEKTH